MYLFLSFLMVPPSSCWWDRDFEGHLRVIDRQAMIWTAESLVMAVRSICCRFLLRAVSLTVPRKDLYCELGPKIIIDCWAETIRSELHRQIPIPVFQAMTAIGWATTTTLEPLIYTSCCLSSTLIEPNNWQVGVQSARWDCDRPKFQPSCSAWQLPLSIGDLLFW